MLLNSVHSLSLSLSLFFYVLQVCEGYGQTECSAAAMATVPGDFMSGHVGVPLTCNLVKLADVPDMNYYAEQGQGEVGLLFIDITSLPTIYRSSVNYFYRS